MLLGGSFLLALLAGWAARRVRVPGGAIVGALVAAAVVSLTIDRIVVPEGLRIALLIGLGASIGARVDRTSIRSLPRNAAPALLAGTLIVGGGLGIAFLLRAVGHGFDGDMLATSPGALSVLAAAAIENDLDAPLVSLFHILRIVLILLTLPLLLQLLPPGTKARAAPPGTLSGARDARPGASDIGWLLATVVGAAAGGLLALTAGIEGALIVGTVLGGAAVTLCNPGAIYRPGWLLFVVQAGIGWMIGALVTDETLRALQDAVVPALLSSVLLILIGVGIALLLRYSGIAPAGDVLATSPGALEALASLADERNAGPLEVALFHTVRLLLVILSLPLLLALS